MQRYTDRERKLRQEYSKWSRRVRQQLKRLGSPAMNERYAGEFPTIKDLEASMGGKSPSIQGWERAVRRVRGVYKSGVLTKTGLAQRQAASIDRLHELGYDWVGLDNIDAMWAFVDEARDAGLDSIYGYRIFIDLYERSITDPSINDEILQMNVERWQRNLDKFNKERENNPDARPKKLYVRKKQRNSSNGRFGRK